MLRRRCYIRFIRKVNEKKGADGQEETRKAYDFMLNYVGMFPLRPLCILDVLSVEDVCFFTLQNAILTNLILFF